MGGGSVGGGGGGGGGSGGGGEGSGPASGSGGSWDPRRCERQLVLIKLHLQIYLRGGMSDSTAFRLAIFNTLVPV